MSQTHIFQPKTPDVLILGVGPSASLAAMKLVRLGMSVTVVGRLPVTPRIEGTSPRVVALLSGFGLSGDGIGSALRRQVVWGDLPGAPNSEHIVDRGILDKSLLHQARDAGVNIVDADIARVTNTEVETSLGQFRAGMIIEARGRRSPVAPGALRGPSSVALCGVVPLSNSRHPALYATPLGWVWAAPLSDTQAWLQIAVDHDTLRGGKAALPKVWTKFFAQPELQGSGLSNAPIPNDLHRHACELRLSAPTLQNDRPRIGDAAAAFDPLSGHGLFWALSSALMLPPVLQAILDGQANLAEQFYKARLQDTFWRQARIARDFYAACPDWAATPFWRKRQNWPDTKAAHATRDTPRIANRVVVENGRLRRADVLLTPQEPDGVGFVLGQPLAPILQRLRQSALPARQDFAGFAPDIPPALAGSLHDWLVSRGLPVAGRLTQSQPMETHS